MIKKIMIVVISIIVVYGHVSKDMVKVGNSINGNYNNSLIEMVDSINN